MAVTITCQMFLHGAIFQSNCLNSNSKYLAKQNYYLTLSAHKLHKLELSCGLVSKLNDFLESAWQSINIQQIKGPFKAFSTHLLTVHSQTVQAKVVTIVLFSMSLVNNVYSRGSKWVKYQSTVTLFSKPYRYKIIFFA